MFLGIMSGPIFGLNYVIVNRATGTVADLNKSSSDDGTPIQGWHLSTSYDNSKVPTNRWWCLLQPQSSVQSPTLVAKIQSVAAGTVFDLDPNQTTDDACDVEGWKIKSSGSDSTQIWQIEESFFDRGYVLSNSNC